MNPAPAPPVLDWLDEHHDTDRIPLPDRFRDVLPPQKASGEEEAALPPHITARLQAAGVAVPTVAPPPPALAPKLAPPPPPPAVTAPPTPAPAAKPAPAPAKVAAPPAPVAKPTPARIPAPPPPPLAPELPDECEVSWRGYPLRTSLPSLLIGGGLTYAWVRYALPTLPQQLPAAMLELFDTEIRIAPIVALWLILAVRVMARWFGYGVRLTTRRAFQDRGILYPVEEAIDLASVVSTKVHRGFFGLFLGYGMVELYGVGNTPPFRLEQIGLPGRFAKQVMALAEQARDGSVVGVRVGDAS